MARFIIMVEEAVFMQGISAPEIASKMVKINGKTSTSTTHLCLLVILSQIEDSFLVLVLCPFSLRQFGVSEEIFLVDDIRLQLINFVYFALLQVISARFLPQFRNHLFLILLLHDKTLLSLLVSKFVGTLHEITSLGCGGLARVGD